MKGYGEANYGRKKCPQCTHGKKKKVYLTVQGNSGLKMLVGIKSL